jgi:hypothetical protein
MDHAQRAPPRESAPSSRGFGLRYNTSCPHLVTVTFEGILFYLNWKKYTVNHTINGKVLENYEQLLEGPDAHRS